MSWRRRQSAAKTQFEKLFDDSVAAKYKGMVEAAKEKKDKNGRVIRPAQVIPFTQFEFGGWLLIQFRNNREGVVQCEYCTKFLSIEDVTIDHKIPKGAPWYGSFAFDNLCCCCGPCNSTKGRISAEGFKALIAWAQVHLDPRDMRDMVARMANGSGYRPLQGRYLALQKKAGKGIPGAKIPPGARPKQSRGLFPL